MKLNIEYCDSTEELLLNGNSPNVCDLNNLNNLNLLVRADTGTGADNDELLIYQFQRDFFFEKSQELKELEETAAEAAEETVADAAADNKEQQLQSLQPLRELCALHGRGAVILINDNKHTAYVEETDDVANSIASILGSDEDAYEDEEAEQAEQTEDADQANQASQASPSDDAENAEEVGSDMVNTGNTVNTVATVGTEDPVDAAETADNSEDPADTLDAAETAETANTSDTVGSVSSSDSDGSDGSDGDEAEEAANSEDAEEVPTISTFYWNTAIIIITTASDSTSSTSSSSATPTSTAASVHITRYLVKKIRKISGYKVTHREGQTANNCEINCGENNCENNCENLPENLPENISDNILYLTAFFILKNVLQTQAVRVVRGEDQQNSPSPSAPSIPTARLFIINQAKGVYATARLLSEKRILVLAGSRISKEDSLVHQKGQEASERLRQGLIEAGVIDEQERTFITDYEFHSTSSAASVILGQSANGLTTWRDGQGRKLNELLGRRN